LAAARAWFGRASPPFTVSDAAADWQNAWRSTLLREIRSTRPSVTEFAPSNANKKTMLAVTSIGFAAVRLHGTHQIACPSASRLI
jgi:hypothetical protein